MTQRLLALLLTSTLLLSTGCGLFSKKDRAKESTAIAADVEETFRRRWVEKRTGELVAQGTETSAARAQADAEFQQKYGFNPRKK